MMQDELPSKQPMSHGAALLRVPLFRLLAINLAAGIAVAALLVGGLLAFNPGGLRDLIFADASPGIALGLLLFGFIVTFGSAAMGSAIMAMGQCEGGDEEPRGSSRGSKAATVKAVAKNSRFDFQTARTHGILRPSLRATCPP